MAREKRIDRVSIPRRSAADVQHTADYQTYGLLPEAKQAIRRALRRMGQEPARYLSDPE